MARQPARKLKVDELIRLTPGGTVYRVVRVNDCAAYLKRRNAEGKVVTLKDRTFTVWEEGNVLAVSPYSMVERVDQAAAVCPDCELELAADGRLASGGRHFKNEFNECITPD